MNKKLYIFFSIFLLLLLVNLGNLSAGIYKDVEDEKNIKIKDKYWIDVFGWFSEEVADLELLTPLDNRVGLGYQKVAEYEVNSKKDVKMLVSKMDFYDRKDNMKQINRDIDYKIKTIEEVEVNDYSCKDVLSSNGTITQDCFVSGTHLENKTRWVDLNKFNFKTGEKIIVGLFTNVQKGDKVEWIPTFQIDDKEEVRIEEWATWTEDLNVGLVSYYKFDETSGTTAFDSLYLNNATNNGADINVVGKIGTAYDFEKGDSDYLISNPFTTMNGDFSVSAWVKPESRTNDYVISFSGSSNGIFNDGTSFGMYDGTSVVGVTASGTASWFFIVMTKSGTTYSLYVYNETSLIGNNSGTLNDINVNEIRIGSRNSLWYYDGVIDEVGIWNRTLSTDEVTQLYNEGDGISYTDESQLEITLLTPENHYNSSSSTIDFSANVSDVDASGIQNVSLYIDGVLNQTNSSGTEGIYNWSVSGFTDGDYNWSVLAYDDSNTSVESNTRYFTVDLTDPVISANVNETILYAEGDTILLNTTVTDNNLDTVWYSYNGTNTTISGAINNTLNQTTITTTTSALEIIVYANDSSGNEATPVNFTLTLDDVLPQINISYPTGTIDYKQLNTNETLNVTITDTNLDTCWYNYNGTNITFSCSTGVLSSEEFNITTSSNSQSITVYANDTVGNENSTIRNWVYRVLENSRTHNTTSYETASESYSINLTANSSLTAVDLIYNGTEYAMTKSGTVWSYSRDLPSSVVGNNSINFSFTYAGNDISPNFLTYQNVQSAILVLCNATITEPFINFTFKDEGDLSDTTGQLPLSTFEYYLGGGDETKEYQYVNNTNNSNYAFCFSPSDREVNIDMYIQYKNDNAPQRIYNPSVTTFSNTTTNYTLYLLESTDGLYVTFQVVNSGQQTLSGVNVNATREISGSTVLIGQGVTGDDGSVTFWLNPDFDHTFSFSKTGFDTYTTTFTPTQSSYTVTLSGGTTTEESYSRGISRLILPTNSSLINDTTYTFGFQLNSSYWDIDEYGFNLRLRNGTIITGDSTSTEATLLTKDYNTGNQTRIYMDYYWVIEGNYTNVSMYWNVYNTANTQWSIKTFFTDLTLYMDSGLFGIDDFGKKLFIFLILFITIGTLGYKYGASDPVFLAGIIFGVIFFFDVAVGLIPSYVTSGGREIEHAYTFIAGLLLALAGMREVMR